MFFFFLVVFGIGVVSYSDVFLEQLLECVFFKKFVLLLERIQIFGIVFLNVIRSFGILVFNYWMSFKGWKRDVFFDFFIIFCWVFVEVVFQSGFQWEIGGFVSFYGLRVESQSNYLWEKKVEQFFCGGDGGRVGVWR